MKRITKVLTIGLAVFGMLSFFGCDNAAGGGGSVTPVDVSGAITSAEGECKTKVTTSSFSGDLSGDWDFFSSQTHGAGSGVITGAGVVTIEKSNSKYKIYAKPGTESKQTWTSSTPCTADEKSGMESDIKTEYPDAKFYWSNDDKTVTIVMTVTKKESLNDNSADEEYDVSKLLEVMLGKSDIYTNSGNTKFYSTENDPQDGTFTRVYVKK